MGKKLASLLLVLVLAGMASAASWKGGAGEWEDPTKWEPPGVPAEGDLVGTGITYAYITVNASTNNIAKLQMQNLGGASIIEIKSGGTLNCDGSIEQGKGNSSLMQIDAGGVFNAARKLTSAIGTYKLSSAAGTTDVIDVYGTLNVKGSMATSDLSVAAGSGVGIGRVTIRNGGLVNVDAYLINSTVVASGANMGEKRGKITIESGGLMKILGNKTAQVAADITAGTIVGPSGMVAWLVTEGATQYTYVPEPATIALLGLGGLLLRRKR